MRGTNMKIMYQHVLDYQLLYRYDSFNISVKCTIVYGVSSCEPSSRLLPHLPKAAPS